MVIFYSYVSLPGRVQTLEKPQVTSPQLLRFLEAGSPGSGAYDGWS